MTLHSILNFLTGSRFPNWRAAENSADLHRREKDLAIARVFLSVTSLVAIYIDPTEPSRFAHLAYGLLLAYVVYSIAILLFLRGRKTVGRRVPIAIHSTSLLWAAIVSLFTSGPSSAFFVFFIFVILAASYRWRMRESLITTAILVLILLAQAALYSFPFTANFLGGEDFDLNRVIMRGAYLLIMGVFAGLLGEKEKQFSSEIAVINDLLRGITVKHPVEKNFQSVVTATRQIFQARNVMLVLHAIADDRYQTVETDGISPTFREVSQVEGRKLFSPLGAAAIRVRGTDPALVANAASSSAHSGRIEMPTRTGSWDREVLAADAAAGDDWRVRLFVIDPDRNSMGEESLHFLERMLTQLVPSIHNTFLVRRTREQVGALERASIARELHDGPIQSLSSARLQLSTLRTKMGATGGIEDIDRISEIIGGEVLNLRDLIQHIRSSNVAPDELLSAAVDMTERFERETGISVRLASLPEKVDLPGKACSEVLYILQEALINVRKHSKATMVLVALEREENTWRLTIDDDGVGFPFEGYVSWRELQDSRKGPIVIKERVRLLGGRLDIHSIPGSGSRLEIIIPEKVLSNVL